MRCSHKVFMSHEVVIIMTHYLRVCGLSFNGETDKEFGPMTNYGHHHAGNSLGNYGGRPFVSGGKDGQKNWWHSKTEIFDFESGEWKPEKDYPFED